MGALNHNTSKKIKQKAEAWDDQRTHSHCSRKAKHTHGERERERSPTQCNKNKTETVTVLRPCSQAGRQQCVSCKREHQRAGMGVHAYIQWAHYVCASWGEVRARVHARGHTQREREKRVCVRAVHGSLSLTLTRPPPQQQPHTQQQKAKEGRWCGRPRCCRHCRQVSFHLFWRLWLALLRILHSEGPYRICWLMQLRHRKSFRVMWRLQWRVGSDDWWLECLLCQHQTAGPRLPRCCCRCCE
ncbi:hypothetical protein ECC02_010152 [Trypanosoma cruzi]|uniref:Uncharacterized protein n=1 Tax=Trypanosoma cruzi TaxID=5693 RepID=A0A7J6XS92_TRYCR|nr:hypothetical protein ECC02_010152 [Trypanosoma cruzi]